MNDIEKRARELLDAECIIDAGSDGKAGVEAKIVHRAAVRAIIAALTAQWQPIETAPKSVADGRGVEGVYVLGFIPDSELVDPQTGIDVVWWEPLLVNSRGGRGRWQSTRHGDEVAPTHWMPLPAAPEVS